VHAFDKRTASRLIGAASATDKWAHRVAFMTIRQIAVPKARREDSNAYAWFKEGFGYVASLRLTGTADTRFASEKGTGDKMPYSVPAPINKNRAEVEAWLRAQMEDGLGIALPDLCNRGLNQMDFLVSMQAASFVRFLLQWDPEAFKKLPALLTAATGKNDRERTDLVMRAAYGKTLNELEPLWLAFTLEINVP
jgi:hypothetical protein